MAHLRRLNRLGTLLGELVNEDIPLWEKKDNEEYGEIREYVTAKDSYNQMFPELSERTRQRDFEFLREIGYITLRHFSRSSSVIYTFLSMPITIILWKTVFM